MLSLSTAPTLCDGELAPRHLDLRPFVLSGGDGYVTEGGLTRVALHESCTLVVNSSGRGRHGHLDPGSIEVTGPPQWARASSGASMWNDEDDDDGGPGGGPREEGTTWRCSVGAAERVYWTGRSWSGWRPPAVAAGARALYLDTPRSAGLAWAPLLAVSGSPGAFDGVPERRRTTWWSTSAPTAMNASSVLASLAQARKHAAATEGRVPREVWEVVNNLCFDVVDRADEAVPRWSRHGWLARIVDRCHVLVGVMASTMTRDDAYDFLRIGQGSLERADIDESGARHPMRARRGRRRPPTTTSTGCWSCAASPPIRRIVARCRHGSRGRRCSASCSAVRGSRGRWRTRSPRWARRSRGTPARPTCRVHVRGGAVDESKRPRAVPHVGGARQ